MNIPDIRILSGFATDNDFSACGCHIRSINTGHINSTFEVESRPDEDGLCCRKYIVQKINTNIFRNPHQLMENIAAVTGHIMSKLKTGGDDYGKCTLEIVKTHNGGLYLCDSGGDVWRCYKFIENSEGLDTLDLGGTETYAAAGKALGAFQNALTDFDASRLFEIIPNFHDTENRFAAFEASVLRNASGRASNVQNEIAFARSRKDLCGIITGKLKNGDIPLRVTHNDTKLSNILADRTSREVLCFIDLDTVMPGSALYDFGDALRSAACSGAEDEPDTDLIFFKSDVFEAFCDGYLSVAGKFLTDSELLLLPESVIIMTYECGIRFLADYIDGDTYFSVAYPEHNLIRARTQFKMVYDMERKLSQTQNIASALVSKYKTIK